MLGSKMRGEKTYQQEGSVTGYIHKDKLPNVLKLTDPRLHGLQLRPGVSSNFQTYDNVSFEASWATTQVILTC
jgi:hypothetical protein